MRSCLCFYTFLCVLLLAVSGGNAVELQQPGSWKRCVHHRELWIRLHSCRHGSHLHQGPVQGYARIDTHTYTYINTKIQTHCLTHFTFIIKDLFIDILASDKTFCVFIHRYADGCGELPDCQCRIWCKSTSLLCTFICMWYVVSHVSAQSFLASFSPSGRMYPRWHVAVCRLRFCWRP